MKSYKDDIVDLIFKAQDDGISDEEIKTLLVEEFQKYALKVPVIFTYVYCDREENQMRGRVGSLAGYRNGTLALKWVQDNQRPTIRSTNKTAVRYWDFGRSAWRAFRKECFIVISSFYDKRTKTYVDTPEEARLSGNWRNSNHLYKRVQRESTEAEKVKQKMVAEKESVKRLEQIHKTKSKMINDSVLKKAFDENLIDQTSYENLLKLNNKKRSYSTCIIQNINGEILFVRRNSIDTFEPNTWCLPGGKIEEGEEPLVTCLREVYEETLITLPNLSILNTITLENGETINYFISILQQKIDPILDEEHSNYEWLSTEKWLRMNDLILNLKDHLQKLLNVSTTSSFEDIKKSFIIIENAFNEGLISTEEYVQSFDRYNLLVKNNKQPNLSERFSNAINKGINLFKDIMKSGAKGKGIEGHDGTGNYERKSIKKDPTSNVKELTVDVENNFIKVKDFPIDNGNYSPKEFLKAFGEYIDTLYVTSGINEHRTNYEYRKSLGWSKQKQQGNKFESIRVAEPTDIKIKRVSVDKKKWNDFRDNYLDVLEKYKNQVIKEAKQSKVEKSFKDEIEEFELKQAQEEMNPTKPSLYDQRRMERFKEYKEMLLRRQQIKPGALNRIITGQAQIIDLDVIYSNHKRGSLRSIGLEKSWDSFRQDFSILTTIKEELHQDYAAIVDFQEDVSLKDLQLFQHKVDIDQLHKAMSSILIKSIDFSSSQDVLDKDEYKDYLDDLYVLNEANMPIDLKIIEDIKIRKSFDGVIVKTNGEQLIDENEFNSFLEQGLLYTEGDIEKGLDTSKLQRVRKLVREKEGNTFLRTYWIAKPGHKVEEVPVPEEKVEEIKDNEEIYSQDQIEGLKKLGVEVMGGRVDMKYDFFNKNFPGFNLQEYFSNALESVKLKLTDAGVEFKPKDIKSSVTFDQREAKIEITYKPKDKQVGVKIARAFEIDVDDKPFIQHDELVFGETLRERGFAKDILVDLYKQYMKAGITDIRLTAGYTDIKPINGANTWGQFGFTVHPDNFKTKILPHIKDCIGKSFVINKEGVSVEFDEEDYASLLSAISAFHSKYSHDARFPMIEIHNQLGKKALGVLQGCSWDGRIDLSNPQQRTIFEKRLGLIG